MQGSCESPGVPDAVIVALVFVVGPLALVLPLVMLVKRRHKRFGSDGAIAETFASDDGTFTLTAPAAQPIGVYCEYTIDAVRQSAGIRYGLRLRLDVERAGFEQRGEYLIGQAQRPFGEVALAEIVDGGPHIRNGMHLRRAMLLARVPAGEAVKISGKVERTGGEGHTLHVYVKAA